MQAPHTPCSLAAVGCLHGGAEARNQRKYHGWGRCIQNAQDATPKLTGPPEQIPSPPDLFGQIPVAGAHLPCPGPLRQHPSAIQRCQPRPALPTWGLCAIMQQRAGGQKPQLLARECGAVSRLACWQAQLSAPASGSARGRGCGHAAPWPPSPSRVPHGDALAHVQAVQ